MIVVFLESRHAVVTSVANVSDAVAGFERIRPDIVLADIGMPHEDGFSLIRGIRERPATEGGATPVVALTAYARTEDRTRTLRAGFNIHLPKPVDMAELTAVITSLARHRR